MNADLATEYNCIQANEKLDFDDFNFVMKKIER